MVVVGADHICIPWAYVPTASPRVSPVPCHPNVYLSVVHPQQRARRPLTYDLRSHDIGWCVAMLVCVFIRWRSLCTASFSHHACICHNVGAVCLSNCPPSPTRDSCVVAHSHMQPRPTTRVWVFALTRCIASVVFFQIKKWGVSRLPQLPVQAISSSIGLTITAASMIIVKQCRRWLGTGAQPQAWARVAVVLWLAVTSTQT